ncbi:MAG: PEP-CTERM sorting domain-containing protein [Terrimicrobiaceae bacterium]
MISTLPLKIMNMRNKAILLAVFVGLLFSKSGTAQTNWTGLGVDATDWSEALNWSAGAPSSTTVANLVFPAGDTDDIIIGADSVAMGLVYGSDLSFSRFLVTGPGVSLTIGASGLTNSSSLAIEHAAATVLSSNSTFSAGALGLTMEKSLSVQTNTLSVASSVGSLILQGGTSFGISSLSTFGKIAGTGSVQLSGALTFSFTSAVGAGSWDFINQTPSGTLSSVQLSDSYAGGLTQSTPGLWTGSIGGLDWSYASSTGVLTAVPEPSTWLLLTAGLTTMVIFRRRRQS